MSIKKLSENWLFETHPKNEIIYWINNLVFFYFIRAWGGNANDGNEFKTSFLIENEDDLITKLNLLGIKLNEIPKDFLKPIIGKSYSADEFEKFKSVTIQFPYLEQPGHTKIFEKNVFMWINKNSIDISISGTENGDYFEVTDEDFKTCKFLERIFQEIGLLKYKNKKIEDNVCCVSKTKYPELYYWKTLETYEWVVKPLKVSSVKSSFFEDENIFPKGSIKFDNAILMENVEHEWKSLKTINHCN